MTEDIRLYPFPMTNREQVEAVRERLAQKLTYKPTAEVNFAKAHLPIICCFDGKILYITDDNLRPMLYFESTSFINACTISDTAKYAVCQTANNTNNDADGGATMLFDIKGKRLLTRKHIEVDWRDVTHLFIDENAERIWVYCGDKKVADDFNLCPDVDMLEIYLRECREEPTASPYLLNSRVRELISKAKTGELKWGDVEREALDLLERLNADANMSQYQLSITYRELGDFYSERKVAAKAVSAYETGLALNPNLSVKKKLNQERKKALAQ